MDEQASPLPQVTEGMSASRTRRIGADEVRAFADATGDTNPIHFDEAIAEASIFGRPVAHGMISGGLISALLGTELPGPGTIYLSQTLRFKRPVYVGDVVTVTLTVTAVDRERHECTLDAQITNEAGKVTVEGEARVRLP